MSTAIICYRNILESGTVTVTSENASFPKAALYDRDIGFLFKGNSTPANFYITLDQGAVISYEVDRLMIPAGHNLDGRSLKLQHSTVDFPITTVTLGTGGSGYSLNDILTIVQAGATGGSVRVTGVSGGVITSISLETAGSKYSVENGLATTGGTGAGATINITGVDATDAVAWTQSGSGLIDKTFTAQTKRYWRSNIASPAAAPELAEMFLTKQVTFIFNPEYGGPVGKKRNVDRTESSAGQAQKIKNGEARRPYKYGWSILETAEKTLFEAWDDHCDGIKNFYLIDTDGNTVFVERLGDLMFVPIGPGQYQTAFDLLEVLP